MLLVACLLFFSANAVLEPDFGHFVEKTYGVTIYEKLNRADMGKDGAGSFGGGKVKSSYRPVVFVHGLRNRAGNLWKHRAVFTMNEFPPARLIATTYGPGDVGVFNALQQKLECAHVKQVRFMITSAAEYYNSTVDVISFSMGSPLARKPGCTAYVSKWNQSYIWHTPPPSAILGGKCVDTKEDLGPPLTEKIVTYLSVAGANHGSFLCNIPFPGICNMKNGLTCNSEFLRDINSKSKYEGRFIYSIASSTDEITGFYTICGRKSYEMQSYHEILRHGLTHQAVIDGTIQQQVNIIKRHNP